MFLFPQFIFKLDLNMKLQKDALELVRSLALEAGCPFFPVHAFQAVCGTLP